MNKIGDVEFLKLFAVHEIDESFGELERDLFIEMGQMDQRICLKSYKQKKNVMQNIK